MLVVGIFISEYEETIIMPEQFEVPGQCELPDDVITEEMTSLILGQTNRREEAIVVDQRIESMLADAGIETNDEDDIYDE